MVDCSNYECERTFATAQAAHQHQNAVGHWECETCARNCFSQTAIRQHMNDAGHWLPRYPCEACDSQYLNPQAARRHMDANNHWRKHWCRDCKKGFQNENNLKMHMQSNVHLGSTIKCPFCKRGYTTASGVIRHVETSACPNAPNVNRETLYDLINRKDPHGLITKKLIGWKPEENAQMIASDRSWDGDYFRCYLCGGGFTTLRRLNQHLESDRHRQKIYRCFGRRCPKEFTSLAALFHHLESESCGATRFSKVQEDVKQIMDGRRLLAFR